MRQDFSYPHAARIVLLALIAGALAPALLRAADAAGAPGALPSAEQIVERNVQARGGPAAWRKVQAMQFTGQMDAGGKVPTALPIVMDLKRPNKSRVELQFQGKTAVQVFDGSAGWKLRPFLGREDAEPFTVAEIKVAAAQSGLDGPLMDYAAQGTQVALDGVEQIEGQDAYRLKLTTRAGAVSRVWIDASSFLELKIDGAPRVVDGRLRHVETYFRDYRNVDGLMVPFVVETAVEGVKQRHRMSFAQVQLNPPLKDALFARGALGASATVVR